MIDARCPGPEVLLLAAHDLLDEDDDAARAHLAACDACARARDALAASLATPPLPFQPEDVLPALKEKLAAHDAATPAVSVGVRLLCTYCKDGATTAETVYCAACLAPHHADCFGEHGRCAAPGCEGVQVVRTTAAPPARPRRRAWPLLGLGLLVGGGAVAALTAGPAPAPSVVAPAPAPAPETLTVSLRRVVYPLDGALAALARPDEPGPAEPDSHAAMRRRLSSQQITLNFDGTPLEEAIDFMRDITGLSFVLEPGTDVAGQKVSVRLRNVSLEGALRLLVEPAGLTWTLRNGAVVISAPGTRRVLEPRYPPSRPADEGAAPPRAELLRRAEEGARRACVAALGARAWDPPASLEVRDERELVVTQREAGHAALRTWLASLGGITVPDDLRDAWFAPGNEPADPTQARAAQHLATFGRRKLTLNFPDTPLREVVQFLRDLYGPELRVDAGVVDRFGDARVTLRVRDLAAAAALEHVVAQVEGLVLDVDRDGVLLRPHDVPSLEGQLAECARRATVDTDDRELLHALERPLSLSVDETPLGELVALLQDTTGLNLALDPRVAADTPVSLSAKDRPLIQVLEQALAPVGLGLSPRDGILRLVPRAEATLRPDLDSQRELLRARPMAWPATSLDVAALTAALEQATGARVVLTARTRATPPVRGEGGTVADALTLAERQAGLRHVWTLLPGTEQHVLVLDARHDVRPLRDALALLGEESPWTDAPATAKTALDAARRDLHEGLRALAAPRSDGSLGETAQRAHAAASALRNVLTGHAALAAAPTEQAMAQAREVADELVRQHRLLAAARLAFQAAVTSDERRILDLSARDAALVSEGEALSQAVTDARERLAATELAGGGPAQQEAAAALVAAEERSITRWREIHDERRRLADERDGALKERARRERDFRLEEARLESVLAQCDGRLSGCAPALPAAARAREAARATLAGGAAWEVVFPSGAWQWQRSAEKDALGRVRVAAFAAATLDEGDEVVAVAGAAVGDTLALLDALGQRAGESVAVTVERDGVRQELTLDVPSHGG